MKEYTIVDIGSSSIRTANICENMMIRDMQVKKRKINKCFQPENEWSAVEQLLSGMVHDNTEAVIVSSLLGWIGVDINGRAVTPCYSYMHQENEVYKDTKGLFSEQQYIEICGRKAAPEWLAFKLYALKLKNPEVYQRIYKIVSLKDYINYMLTGEFAEDYTTAAYTCLFDISKKNWSKKLLEGFGLDAGMLPELKAPSEILAALKPQLCKAWKLDHGSPSVMTGSVDGSTAVLGTGGFESGVSVNVMGTTDVFFTPSRKITKINQDALIVNPHVIPGLWLTGGPMGMFGGTVDWLVNHMMEGSRNIEEWTKRAELIAPGSGDLNVFPCMAGERAPFWNGQFTGTILGLGLQHSPAHILRGIMEAEGYTVKHMIEKSQEMGVLCSSIRTIGGGARNDLWLQIKADITGKPVSRMKISEATMYGSLFLCLLGAGYRLKELPEVEEACRLLPDTKKGKVYHALYEQYLERHSILDKIYR